MTIDGSIAEHCTCGYLLRGVTTGRCSECGRRISTDGSTPLSTYPERRFGLSRDFALYHDRVICRARKWIGGMYTMPVSLTQLETITTTYLARSPLFKAGGATAMSGAIILGTLLIAPYEKSSTPWLTWLSAAAIAAGMVMSITSIGLIEQVCFRAAGRPDVVLLNVARCGPDRDEFDQFISTVTDAIDATHTHPEK